MSTWQRSDGWPEYAGDYQVELTAGLVTLTVFEKNGCLYLRHNLLGNQAGVKLNPHRTGLFFTADGRAVRFHAGGMRFGDICTVKEAD